jgi:hypothetical protein
VCSPREVTLEEYKKACREIVPEEEMRGFSIHVMAYVFATVMLIPMNFLFFPQVVWFFYPLISWGIGLTIHHLFSVRWIEQRLKDREARAE